ncbi:MAG TPA: sigma-70 family RNA polymerase sigma factor [Opitutaceae bacterium]|nr:sigma-70 family RNA polymerase sigma factor [Opitutaceae bacterium]
MAITRDRILEIARSLPPAPRVFSDLDRLLRDANSGLDRIGELIKRDASLAAHILRVSNSVTYGGEQKTGSVEEAVARVGFHEIFRIVGEVATARLADRPLKYYGVDTDQLREHMIQTAFVCESLALQCGLDARSAYTVGLMRLLGLLVLDRLAESYPNLEPYHPAHDPDYLTWEGRTFGLSSCEVAAMVLMEWKFPAEIVEGMRNQYLLRSDDLGHRLAVVLNLAGGIIAEDSFGLLGEARHWGHSPWKLEAVGLTEVSYLVAATRGREAYAEFRQRMRGEVVAPKPAAGSPSVDAVFAAIAAPKPAPAPAAAPVAAVAAAEVAQTSAGPEHGAIAIESSNFPLRVRVVSEDNEPPVQTLLAAPLAPSRSPAPAAVTPVPADFPSFMRSYQDMVFSTAARITANDAQAEDIAQEVFLKAYENFDHLRTSPTAGGWLKTVATNLSLNHLARYRNRWKFFSEFKRADTAGDELPEVEFAAPETFFAGVDAADRRALVKRALEQLPEHQRVPLVLYHFEDLPYDEIAKKLRVSLAKVKTDILRARAALAKILGRSGAARENLSP